MTSEIDARAWVAASSPGLNRPLVPAVERIARPVRDFATSLTRSVDHDSFERLFAPTREGLGFTLTTAERPARAAWALVAEWLVAFGAGAISTTDPLQSGHEWFWAGHPEAANVLNAPGAGGVPVAEEPELVNALLPYLLDPMAAATRRDVLNARSTTVERTARKSAGVYYTPGDVACAMVDMVATNALDDATWLDLAHGSGVFLRAVLSTVSGELRPRLYGVDIDPMAAETTSFVLTSEDLRLHPDGAAPWERWHLFRRQLATGDALLVDAGSIHGTPTVNESPGSPSCDKPWKLEDVFPEIWGHGFDRVVANPPYAALKPGPSAAHLASLHPVTGPSARSDISPVFVEVAAAVLAPDGALSMVTPLSEVTSSRRPFPELRSYLADQAGSVEFQSFDRVPDALFGDDIKTRNAILHLDRAAQDSILVSPLRRWTSRTRVAGIAHLSSIDVANVPGVPARLPKIGTQWELELLSACMDHNARVDDWVTARTSRPLQLVHRTASDSDSVLVAVAPTAYNFLGVIRDPFRAVTDGHDSQNALALLQFDSEDRASAAYAILASRLAFWLWHVTGDGFHVTRGATRTCPIPESQSELDGFAELGDRLWKEALQQQLVSRNRGRVTVAYPTWRSRDLLDEIDARLGRAIGADTASLGEWHEALVVVDAESDRRNLARRTRL